MKKQTYKAEQTPLSEEELLKILKDYNDFLFHIEPSPETVGGLTGWICPKCGAVISPFESCCVKCSNNWELTCNTGGNE